ncbi:MAG: RecQ family ATP-dependent DNA helicase, partial [Flavobacteriaceae bacterium]|nr:RecQ family ATP-dependent DNA helicase [Flavobacteriaceae bacterium]
MNSAKAILQKYWAHQEFREPQQEIINAVLDKQNTIALLPTGAGKSICFQIPALINNGVCIVISPLISLMEDQVNSLKKKGIKAIALTSRYNTNEVIQLFDNLQFGNYKFLYLSPEKLQSEFIQEKISQLKVNLIAIDEAHCISQWGHDFRPAYLKIAILKKIHPNTNIIALTASATPKVIEDIIKHLELDNIQIFKKSFFRKNIRIQLIKSDAIFEQVKQILVKVKEPVIIYTSTRKNTIQISNYLNHQGFKSTFFHGGLPNETKSKTLNNWVNESTPIIVATNAFGMGIDKANVRAVIHVHIPNSIENYMQEIGRAGRDNKTSNAYLIYNNSTIFESKTFIEKGIASTEFCKTVYGKLHENYQISFGELHEKSFTFNLQDFCNKYQLPILKVFSALNCFENEGIISVQQNVNKKSSLKVIVKNKYLIDYENKNQKSNTILKVILRNYGGAFDQFISISESVIAKKLNTSKTDVITLLHRLDTDNIIRYKKASNNAGIRFLVPREDRFVMHSISKNIENRNKTKISKAKAVVDYIANDKIC